jgi:hypothetical protein
LENVQDRPVLGRPDGLFVLPKSEMDQLLKKTGGNINEIEKELGIPAGNWEDAINDAQVPSSLIRIDIKPSQIKKLRMPTGNELGANSEWIPSGFTTNGLPEAIIEPIPWNEIDIKQVQTIIKP